MEPSELMLPVVTEENACLPLSVNVVARYWNVDIPLPRGAAKRYPSEGGSVLVEGMELAEAHGLAVVITNTDVQGLMRAIDAGVPPIVVLPGVGGLTHHLSVISGYAEDALIHYIPKSSEEGVYQGAIPLAVFDQKWSQEGRVAIMVAPPGTIRGVDDSRSLRLCMEAERALLLKMGMRAETLLKDAISEDSANMTAWLLLAGMQNERNQKECVESYGRCLQLNGSCYLAYRGLGNYHLKAGNSARAEENYTQAIRIDPDRFGGTYKNRAYVREQMGKYGGAAEDLARYVSLSPRAPDRGAMERAIEELRRIK